MIYTVANTNGIGKPVAVFVNGNRVVKPIRADTVKGEVIYYPTPVRTMKGRRGEELYTRKLRGVVTAEPLT